MIRVTREGAVTTIAIARPAVRNAVDATAEALVATFSEFARDPEASVAVLTGLDGAFCAGGDLKEVAAPRAG